MLHSLFYTFYHHSVWLSCGKSSSQLWWAPFQAVHTCWPGLSNPALCMRLRPLIIMVQSPPQAARRLLQWQQTCSCGWEDAGGRCWRNGLALAQPHSEWQPFRVVCAEASSAVLPTLPLLFVFLGRHSVLLLPCPGSSRHYSLTSFQSLCLSSTLAFLALRIRVLISLTGLDKRTDSSAPFFIWSVLPSLQKFASSYTPTRQLIYTGAIAIINILKKLFSPNKCYRPLLEAGIEESVWA